MQHKSARNTHTHTHTLSPSLSPQGNGHHCQLGSFCTVANVLRYRKPLHPLPLLLSLSLSHSYKKKTHIMNSKTSWETEPLTAHYNSTETEDGLQAL